MTAMIAKLNTNLAFDPRSTSLSELLNEPLLARASFERMMRRQYDRDDLDRIIAFVGKARKFLDDTDLETSESVFRRSDVAAALDDSVLPLTFKKPRRRRSKRAKMSRGCP